MIFRSMTTKIPVSNWLKVEQHSPPVERGTGDSYMRSLHFVKQDEDRDNMRKIRCGQLVLIGRKPLNSLTGDPEEIHSGD